jgi:aminopeptidase N
VALLGWENLFRAEVGAALSGHDVALDAAGVRLGRTQLPRAGHSVVLTARHPRSSGQALAWIAADPGRGAAGAGPQAPHYHKYSYLGFEGEEPANVAKGRWPVLASPLTVLLARTASRRDGETGAAAAPDRVAADLFRGGSAGGAAGGEIGGVFMMKISPVF